MRNLRSAASVLVAGGVLILCASAAAKPTEMRQATFGFESSPVSSPVAGALTTLNLSASGLTGTLTRPGSRFDVNENTGLQAGKPASWGMRSLGSFFAESSATPFVLTFSTPVRSVSVQGGDYGGDSDVAVLKAYSGPNATGTLLEDAGSASYGSSMFPAVAAVSVAPIKGLIRSVSFIGGGAGFAHSFFWDNIVATFAPSKVG